MKSEMFFPLTRTVFVVAAFAVILGVVASHWPLPAVDSETLPEVAAELEAAAPTVSVGDVAHILERPLFHGNRRKPVAVAKVAPKAKPRRVEIPFKLAGIVGADATGRTAYLLNTNSQETIAVKQGQEVDDWRIVEITANAVVIDGAGTRRTLTMTNGG